MPTCRSCGRDNPEGFRFCGFCGAALAERPRGTEVRKTVTIVFCDVTGSTSLGERLDPESLRKVMTRYFDEMRRVIERHGGTVEKFIGDAVMAVFGVPVVHEDDALRAVRAAVEMREALAQLNKELERDRGVTIASRIGLNTGEVVADASGGNQTIATGDAVNVAARLEQAAAPGEILIGPETYRLTRDAITVEPVEPLELKGKSEPMPAFRLEAVALGAEGIARRFDTPMVGRERELRVLRDAFEGAVRDGACSLATVLGPAGVGKSRLIQEFLAGLGANVTALHGRCLPYGDGITYWPFVEMLTDAAGIGDLDGPDEARGKLTSLVGESSDASVVVERTAQLLGFAGATGAAEETHWAVRKLLEAMARRRPLVVVVDDLHWAEPSLLDLVEHIADWSRNAPMELVCTARPELLDARPGWGGGKMNAISFLLEPLDDEESDSMMTNLLGRTTLPEDAGARIRDAAEGNPLFIEQMVAMMVDDGLLVAHEEGWAVEGDLTGLSPPATITALMESRLDRLSDEERSVIERASVEGKVFHRAAVANLCSDELRTSLNAHLMALVRRDLIRPDTSLFAGDDAFRFRNLLIRDAAYQRMPKETRAELHERYANWIEAAAGDRLAEFDEIVGYHLEQACRLRSELGPLDEGAASIARRGTDHLASSAARALDRGDMSAASNLLSRALELSASDSPGRAAIMADLGQALERRGELDRAAQILEECISLAERSGDRALACTARIRTLWVRARAAVVGQEGLLEEAESLVPTLEAAGDASGLAEAWSFIGISHFWLGRCEPALQAMEQALDLARSSGNSRIQLEELGRMMAPITFGPTPAGQGLDRAVELLELSNGSKRVERFVKTFGAVLLAMLGRFDEARRWWQEGAEVCRELGERVLAAAGTMMLAQAELIAGEPEAAERVARQGVSELQEIGEHGYLSTVAFYLAEALLAQGKLEEAEEATELSERNTASDDVQSMAGWRAARAKILAVRGEIQRAEAMAREAVAIIEETDYLDSQAEALFALAMVLRLAGKPREAIAALEEAERKWRAKGHVIGVAHARAELAELRPG
jgi:predicted ATPase/class 3 adenylate cyclase